MPGQPDPTNTMASDPVAGIAGGLISLIYPSENEGVAIFSPAEYERGTWGDAGVRARGVLVRTSAAAGPGRHACLAQVLAHDGATAVSCAGPQRSDEESLLEGDLGGGPGARPQLGAGDLVRSFAGNRAQVVNCAGELVDDIVVRESPRTVHSLNAVSPGLTCSLPFGEHLAGLCTARSSG
jgi:hypothetical protein